MTPRASGRPPAVSPLAIILLLCGLLAPLLLARLVPAPPLPSDHPPFDRRYFWAAQAPEVPTAPLLAAAQIKRVAAARGVPYFVVRRMVDDNTSDKDGINLTALNLALDRHDREK